MPEDLPQASGPRRDLETEVEDLLIYEAVYPPNTALAEHSHALPRFGFLLEGSLCERGNDHQFLMESNAFSYHPPHLVHRNDAGPAGARAVVVELSLSSLLQVMPSNVDAGVPLVVRLPQLRGVALNVARELRASDNARTTAIEGMALDLVSRAARLLETREERVTRRRAVEPAWLADARMLIEQNLGHPDLLALVSQQLLVSPRQVTRAFQQYAGAPFKSYVYGRLLTRALELLRETELPISEVATAAGFYDQAHLGHAVKRYVGMTPTAYRARHRA